MRKNSAKIKKIACWKSMIHDEQQFIAALRVSSAEYMYFKMFICIIVLEKYFIRIYALVNNNASQWILFVPFFVSNQHRRSNQQAQSSCYDVQRQEMQQQRTKKKLYLIFFASHTFQVGGCNYNKIDVKMCKHKRLQDELRQKYIVRILC